MIPSSAQMQARQQHQAAQNQDTPQPVQQTVVGPSQNPQPNVIPNVPQPTSNPIQSQSHQPVGTVSAAQNVNAPMHPVPQSVVVPGGSIVSSGVVTTAAPQQQPPTTQQFNTASLCFLGQDTVQEIVTKVQEIFQILKVLAPPSGTVTAANQSNERRAKIQECVKQLKQSFKRLRIIYEKCNDNSQLQGAEYMHIESLIPVKEEWDMKTSEERKTSEAYRLASDECKELIDLVVMKNNQLKEIIDHLRRIVWEINTMLLMRKS